MSKKNTKTKSKAAPKAKVKVKAKPKVVKAAKKSPASKPKPKSKSAAKAKPAKKVAAVKAKAPVKKAAKGKVAPKAKVQAKKVVPAPKKVVGKVIAPKPLAAKHVAAKPIATKSVATKPIATKPVATKPIAAKPFVGKSVDAKSGKLAKVVPPAKATTDKVAPANAAPTPIFKSSSGRRRKKEKAPTVVKIEVPRNEIPAPPKNRPVIGRPAPFNRRPEPSLTRPKPVVEDSGKTRYSDNELEEFRAIINKKLEEASKELLLLQAQMTAANDHGTDDTASTFKILEDGSDSLAKEEAGQLAGRQKKFIEQLENAMIRIENKTYGICRVSGKLIPKERLRAVPHTTQTIEAKLNQYRD